MTSTLEKWYVSLDELETNLMEYESRFKLNVRTGTSPVQCPVFGECDSPSVLKLQAESLLGFTLDLRQHARIIYNEIYKPRLWRSQGFDENMHSCFPRIMKKWTTLSLEIRDMLVDNNNARKMWPQITSLIWTLTENIDNANMTLYFSAETLAMHRGKKTVTRKNKKIRKVFTAKRRRIVVTATGRCNVKRRTNYRSGLVSTAKTPSSISKAMYSMSLAETSGSFFTETSN